MSLARNLTRSPYASVRAAIASLRLSGIASNVRKERLTYLVPQKLVRIERAMRRARDNQVAGDFLEFGVALGGSSIVIATEARAQQRHFAGFDVFAMIPPPTSDKDDAKSKDRYAVISGGKSKGIGGDQYYGYRSDLYSDVVASFRRFGIPVDGEKVALWKGLFEDTWPQRQPRPVAFAHIDCDWYDPVKFCLAAAAAQLSPGGILMLDDYHDYGGCRIAVDEFRAERPDFIFEDGPNPALIRAEPRGA
jgi:asparagine synthase (glutamine-hydrolysing)